MRQHVQPISFPPVIAAKVQYAAHNEQAHAHNSAADVDMAESGVARQRQKFLQATILRLL
jgi:hypothetical protein